MKWSTDSVKIIDISHQWSTTHSSMLLRNTSIYETNSTGITCTCMSKLEKLMYIHRRDQISSTGNEHACVGAMDSIPFACTCTCTHASTCTCTCACACMAAIQNLVIFGKILMGITYVVSTQYFETAVEGNSSVEKGRQSIVYRKWLISVTITGHLSLHVHVHR